MLTLLIDALDVRATPTAGEPRTGPEPRAGP
jgi:hypothetical protein